MKTTKFYTLLALLLMMGGVTMQAQTEDDFWMGIDPPATGIFSLIEDADGNIIVGATGVYSSSDGGATWSLIGLENSGILRLYEHTDGSVEDDQIVDPLPFDVNADVIEVKDTDFGLLYMDVMDKPQDYDGKTIKFKALVGIYKSTDWDSTWTNVYVDHSGVCEVTGLLKLNNGTMLATVLDHIGMGMGGVFKSTDNGETWSNIGLSDKFPFSLAKNSQDEIYVGCLVLYDPDNPQRGFYKSSDYGETWEEFLPHQCVQSITVDNNDVIYVNLYCDAWSNPFGIYRWENGDEWLYGLAAGMPDRRIEKQFLSRDGYLYAFGQYDNQIYRSRKSVYEEFEIDVVACPENGGTVVGSGIYNFGEFAHLSASANANYQFVGWTNQDGDTISTEQECVHMIARGGQLTANFVSIDAVDETEGKSFTLWPNPASQTVYIDGVEADEVQVYNTLGQVVKTMRGTNEITVAELPQGVYLVRIRDEEGRIFMEKIMVK